MKRFPDELTKTKMPDYERLLENCEKEEQFFLEAHHKRVAFYSSVISAVLAATIAGVTKAPEGLSEYYLLLLAGPVIAVALARIARDGTFRFYQRFLEAVTMRAKLEQALGLTKPGTLPSKANDYWKDEPLIPKRYLDAREDKNALTSEDFIKKYSHLGYQGATRKLLVTIQIVSILLGVGLVALWYFSRYGVGCS